MPRGAIAVAAVPTDRSPATAAHFGRSALLTPANALTAVRLVAAPVLLAAVWVWGATWGAAVAWAVLALSDGADGWIARRQGTTSSGAFLDPLADKILVLGVLAALVERHEVWWVPAVLIAGREIAMSAYRTRVSQRGVSVPARASAKVKTLVQDVAAGLALLPPIGTHHPRVVGTAMWLAAALTLLTGAQYVRDGRGRHVPAAGT